ncbi:uncharacterized protein J3R85_003363 [Psidium guajava]|nr:uncharacterized protein J3R85_003363 [Psidium guajava]
MREQRGQLELLPFLVGAVLLAVTAMAMSRRWLARCRRPRKAKFKESAKAKLESSDAHGPWEDGHAGKEDERGGRGKIKTIICYSNSANTCEHITRRE